MLIFVSVSFGQSLEQILAFQVILTHHNQVTVTKSSFEMSNNIKRFK